MLIGVQKLQNEIIQHIYREALEEHGEKKILPAMKIVLCGVPRSGKTSFWKMLVIKSSKTENERSIFTHMIKESVMRFITHVFQYFKSSTSLSTSAAESHYIHLKADQYTCAVLDNDFHLCSPNTESDINDECFEIYRKILECNPHLESSEKPSIQSDQPSSRQSPSIENTLSPVSSQMTTQLTLPTPLSSRGEQTIESSQGNIEKKQKQSRQQSSGQSTSPEEPLNSQTTIEPKSDDLCREIDKIIQDLQQQKSNSKVSTLRNVEMIINLIDTGGQSAFLQILPIIAKGNALYLVFFSYEHGMEDLLTDKYEGEAGTVNLNHKFTQKNLVLQALRCVSTTTLSDPKKKFKVKALLVGTHIDKCDKPDEIDKVIKKNVELLFPNVLHSANIKEDMRVLRVNNTESDGFDNHRKILRDVIKVVNSDSEPLPGSWLLFSVILRKLKQPILYYDDCLYIARKLHMKDENLKAALIDMHNRLGTLMYYQHQSLENLVICDPSIIFSILSENIIKTFLEGTKHEDEDFYRFKNHGIFTYKHFFQDYPKCVGKKRELKDHEIILLLQHVGIIAPIKIHGSKFECQIKSQSTHKCDLKAPLNCIHQEYILSCVLPDAQSDELDKIEESCKTNCTVEPLIITFKGECTPVGGFCYLFTKLVANQRGNDNSNLKGWMPWIPSIKKDNRSDQHSALYRNKVTFNVDGKFYVTLLSKVDCFKVFIECHGEFERGCEFICHEVKSAIENALNDCPSPAIKEFKLAFKCGLHPHGNHYMTATNTMNPKQLTARCEEGGLIEGPCINCTKCQVWFQVKFNNILSAINSCYEII